MNFKLKDRKVLIKVNKEAKNKHKLYNNNFYEY